MESISTKKYRSNFNLKVFIINLSLDIKCWARLIKLSKQSSMLLDGSIFSHGQSHSMAKSIPTIKSKSNPNTYP